LLILFGCIQQHLSVNDALWRIRKWQQLKMDLHIFVHLLGHIEVQRLPRDPLHRSMASHVATSAVRPHQGGTHLHQRHGVKAHRVLGGDYDIHLFGVDRVAGVLLAAVKGAARQRFRAPFF